MLVRLPTLLDLGVQPLSGPSRVLLCGEADFSYAAALCATQRGAIEVTATAFEEEMELHERYPHAAEALARVRAAGARCDFGVDARELSRRYPSEEWDRVVFNLPQAPPEPRRRNQIQRQRALLREIELQALFRGAPEAGSVGGPAPCVVETVPLSQISEGRLLSKRQRKGDAASDASSSWVTMSSNGSSAFTSVSGGSLDGELIGRFGGVL